MRHNRYDRYESEMFEMAWMIPLEVERNWEATSALLLALMAYPNDLEVERRAACGFRIHGHLVSLMMERGRDPRSLTPRQIHAVGFAAKSRAGARDETLIRHSVLAGTNALPAVYSDRMRLPCGVRDSIDGLGDWLAAQEGMDRRNYQTRVWTRARPVLNLATAFNFVLMERGLTGLEGILFEICLDMSFVDAWVAEANRIAPLIEERCYRRSETRAQPRFEWVTQKVTVSLVPAF